MNFDKSNYIDVFNIPTEANFEVSSVDINEGEAVVFKNTSAGYPAPTEFQWEITPSDRVEYISGDSASKDSNVKFNTPGKYTVQLKAKSEYNEDVIKKEKLINVASYYEKVKNLTKSLDGKELTLSWEKPDMKPIYTEDFGGNGENVPADITVIDNNNDNFKWFVTDYNANSGRFSAMSYSFGSGYDAVDTDDFSY
ncbi:immunoglobulin domain-containing family protein [Riemerella columbipharyngis]|uniref:PKD domain-containing protein n=1 Tax=Riemerella columbipharyngis TaxID=1071918 RepID=A0A1G7ASQ7_9FLAO|nr:hypothetical protein [Riemerella columbipharyngis]SDE17025.1 hypothetical protein SAMN05421544_10457 [Riemerella columbipharyngis]